MGRRWLLLVSGTAGIFMLFASWYAWALRPDSYHDAVMEALNQHHIVYTSLDVRPICLPDPTCIVGDGTHTFSAVVVHNSDILYGLITCYDRLGDCYLDLLTLKIYRLPLRDLRSVRFLPKPIARLWERGRLWLRGALDDLAR